MQWEYSVKAIKASDSFLEFARTKDGYLFDEVAIKKLNWTHMGAEVEFTYTRHGKTIDNLMPMYFNGRDFADARAKCKTKDDFAKSMMVQRLFAEGARQYNERQVTLEEDFMKDM